MSGGAYDYIYYKLEDACKGQMYDAEMDDLITDLCKVLHDLEWWQSGDYSSSDYYESLDEFKKKWFGGTRNERLKEYLNSELDEMKLKIEKLI